MCGGRVRRGYPHASNQVRRQSCCLSYLAGVHDSDEQRLILLCHEDGEPITVVTAAPEQQER